jgi:hypothetical protein
MPEDHNHLPYLKMECRCAPPLGNMRTVGFNGGAFNMETRSRRSKTSEDAELSAKTVKECQWVASSSARIASSISRTDGSRRTSSGLSSCKTQLNQESKTVYIF